MGELKDSMMKKLFAIELPTSGESWSPDIHIDVSWHPDFLFVGTFREALSYAIKLQKGEFHGKFRVRRIKSQGEYDTYESQYVYNQGEEAIEWVN